MIIKNYKQKFLNELSTLYDEKEIESFFYIVLEFIHNKKRIDLALQPEMEMDSSQLNRWEAILSELKTQKPIQYILGETEFYGMPFFVDENTLIPRPETEELVDWIVSDLKNFQPATRNPQLIDIGTGSGCIAIALAKNLINSQISAIDVSEKALAIAQKNAKRNAVEVNFILADILKTTDLQEITTRNLQLETRNSKPVTYDIIVSNPPYIRSLEKIEIKPNVLNYEPHLALFVEDDDALLFYRKIAQLALKNLSENGKLYFEINQYLGKETFELLENMGFKNIELRKDIYGNERMIKSTK